MFFFGNSKAFLNIVKIFDRAWKICETLHFGVFSRSAKKGVEPVCKRCIQKT